MSNKDTKTGVKNYQRDVPKEVQRPLFSRGGEIWPTVRVVVKAVKSSLTVSYMPTFGVLKAKVTFRLNARIQAALGLNSAPDY